MVGKGNVRIEGNEKALTTALHELVKRRLRAITLRRRDERWGNEKAGKLPARIIANYKVRAKIKKSEKEAIQIIF